jgi:hypothetical protein
MCHNVIHPFLFINKVSDKTKRPTSSRTQMILSFGAIPQDLAPYRFGRLSGFTGPVPSATLDKRTIQFLQS